MSQFLNLNVSVPVATVLVVLVYDDQLVQRSIKGNSEAELNSYKLRSYKLRKKSYKLPKTKFWSRISYQLQNNILEALFAWKNHYLGKMIKSIEDPVKVNNEPAYKWYQQRTLWNIPVWTIGIKYIDISLNAVFYNLKMNKSVVVH